MVDYYQGHKELLDNYCCQRCLIIKVSEALESWGVAKVPTGRDADHNPDLWESFNLLRGVFNLPSWNGIPQDPRFYDVPLARRLITVLGPHGKIIWKIHQIRCTDASD